jgi:hypothetical protein
MLHTPQEIRDSKYEIQNREEQSRPSVPDIPAQPFEICDSRYEICFRMSRFEYRISPL